MIMKDERREKTAFALALYITAIWGYVNNRQCFRLSGYKSFLIKSLYTTCDYVPSDKYDVFITFLLDGEYQMIVVDKLTDLTSDLSDLEEFLNDAATIGVSVFELSSMQIRHQVYMEGCPDCSAIGKIINLRS